MRTTARTKDLTGLPSHPRQCRGIGDRLRTCIHIAPTARREPDSCLIERLKDPQCAHPQRHEHNEAPPTRRIEREEHHAKHEGGAEGHEAKCQALSAAARADVRGLHSRLIYGGDPRDVHALH